MMDRAVSTTGECRLLEWDTNFFGIRIARMANGKLSEAKLRVERAWCEQESVKCVYVLADADDDETVQLAERHGLHLVDIRVSLVRALSKFSTPTNSDAQICRPTHLPALMELASTLFTDSRFYMDQHFPRERASALYAEWVRKSCESKEGAVLVVENDGIVAGFITCDPVVGGRGSIGLCGVHKDARGQGIGSQLLQAAVDWFARRGATSVEVATQGRNVLAQQMYQRCGFLTCSLKLWYHWWL